LERSLRFVELGLIDANVLVPNRCYRTRLIGALRSRDQGHRVIPRDRCGALLVDVVVPRYLFRTGWSPGVV
jgi:hypothetical protein